MAEGTLFGGGLTTSSFTSRVKKIVNNNVTASTNVRRKSRQSNRRNIHSRVVLEKVLGITTSSSSGLTCDPNSGLVAYPAGCVIVILNPKKNKQSHIFNTSRKTFSALAFAQNGKYLVTGESGHMPCVRVWDVAERTQVAEVQCHKYGVACVAFSPNGSYIVSVGFQHDRTVSVWEWKKGTVIASNKVSSRVLSVSFSEDNSYFVTAGNRHVKFWYLDASKERRVNSTVPLIGRSGLLGEQQNSTFCCLACGRGKMASSTYCITHTGLLCQFNSRRQLDAWVDLKTTSARCLSVSEAYVFCGCADGTIRVFNPHDLRYVTTLHRPHCLGVDVTQGLQPGHLFAANPEAEYPDTLALTFDPVTRHLTCVYNDHSVYVWDVRDVRNVGKVYSALYHSGCVWSVETYPGLEQSSEACLLPGSFLTCSSDNTIRLWHFDSQQTHSQTPGPCLRRNLYSHDLVKIVYVDDDVQRLRSEGERGEGGSLDGKSGIRVLGISPDGQHLAAGDRSGNLRIFGLQFMDELLKIEAHDSEVLCLEFSPADTGLHLLASASRDRLIHIFNMEKSYSLEQTVYDHSASITAIKFTGVGPDVRMVSCGADKSIYFRTAERSHEGLSFSRTHHVVEKATLYDMDLDSTRTHAALACQDRNIRVYNVRSGKMKRCFKGSLSDDGTLLKVQMDPSGMFLATSCSDKNICIFDYESGECVATLFGHSEIVTGMRFSQDCRHLITVSGDSCVFVWRLDSQMTNSMRKRLAERRQRSGLKKSHVAPSKQQAIRRETYITVPSSTLLPAEEEEEGVMSEEDTEEHPQTPAREDSTHEPPDPMVLQTNGRLPMWARRLGCQGAAGATGAAVPTGPNPVQSTTGPYQPRGRWAEQSDPLAIRAVLETRSLQLPLSPSPCRADGDRGEEEEEDAVEQEEDAHFHPQSLDSLLDEEEEDDHDEEDVGEEDEDDEEKVTSGQFGSSLQRPDFLPLPDSEELFGPCLTSPERSDYILYPANSTTLSTGGEGEFDVKAISETAEDPPHRIWREEDEDEEELTPDSACCVGSAESQASSQEPPLDQDADSLSQVSSTGSSGVEEEEEEEPETLLRQHFDTLANNVTADEKFDTDLRSLQPSAESIFLNPRLSISTRFLSRFQSRIRVGPGSATAHRPTAVLPSIPDEPSINTSDMASSGSNSKLSSSDSGSHLSSVEEESKSEITDKALASQSSLQNMAPPNNSPALPAKTVIGAREKEVTPTLPAARPSRQSYMGTTASSRAKMSHSTSTAENPSEEQAGKLADQTASSAQDLIVQQECKENLPPPLPGNHSARAALHLDLSTSERSGRSPASHKARRRTLDTPALTALATPTEMRSLGKEGRRRISSIEESLAPRALPFTKGSVPVSKAISEQPTQVAAPPRTKDKAEAPSRHLQADTASPPKESEPVQDTAREEPCPAVTGVADETMTLQTCNQIVNEILHTMKRAVGLYNKLDSLPELSEQQVQMKLILQEAFTGVQSELDSLCPPPQRSAGKVAAASAEAHPAVEDSPSRQLRDDRAVALLEKYSEMLLRIAEKKMDCN
ncbi:WD repeat-containing protein 62 [Chanos chanos]|uniref:WD repeat-containing protein 62 n=1 Tax=Chanos chanos TaxID=29144 RepID=A0A6J2VP18_CHACN|nr:mitogen-activated protein kinase-binding protein 1-like [Chanos chanos]